VKIVMLAVVAAIFVFVVMPMAILLSVIAKNPWMAQPALQLKVRGSAPIVVGQGSPAFGIRVDGQLVPVDQWQVMEGVAASSNCGVSAQDLAAIAKVETEWGKNIMTNATGHFGYGQFDIATWAAFGSGNPNDFHDALPAIAATLCAKGYGQNRRQALNNYGGCLTPNCLGAGDYANAIDTTISRITSIALVNRDDALAVASQFVDKTPYLWGGTTSAGLDCSGLVQLVWSKLGVRLPRVAADQFNATQRISQAEAVPGDLVFFSDATGIYHVGFWMGDGMMLDAFAPGTRVRIEAAANAGHIAGFGRVVRPPAGANAA
jgi:hypothetical protein